jgi:DNA-binding NtrC family response regulator
MDTGSERNNMSNKSLTESATVALVGLDAADQACLRKILGCSQRHREPSSKWKVQSEAGVEAVLQAVHREPIALAICDRDRMADAWKDLIDQVAGLHRPPLVIVTSRLADDRLWAEALNLGAYDVIAKPFDASEVIRIAGLAYARWRQGHAAVMHSVA